MNPNTSPAVIASTPQTTLERIRVALSRHLKYTVGVVDQPAEPRDVFNALSLTAREFVLDAMGETEARVVEASAKRVYYLSMEFLVGQSLENNLRNLQILDDCRTAVRDECGVELETILNVEPDAGLGNGGLGRLAACFLDSMATIGLPGYGYGINYEYGLFRQEIHQGEQREKPDNWLTYGSPWLVERPNEVCIIPLYGHVEHTTDIDGHYNPMWVDWQAVIAIPHDLPIVGAGGTSVNFLRLFSACGSRDFDMTVFNEGDYMQAVAQKVQAETISKVLYPSDAVASGKELRLIQEYFLVACSLRDLVRRHESQGHAIEEIASKSAIQLNDTHPSLAVAELMRILVDERDLPWEQAWELTQATLAYTNHTLLPEALERWPVSLIERVLPRHLQIIFEINQRFLEQISQRWPGDVQRFRKMSIIQEGDERQVRMCNLAVVGSHSINGVSAMHSELVKESLLPEFFELWPERFTNKTNGITPRRWLSQANPALSGLIRESIGDGWITDLDQLRLLEEFAQDGAFQSRFRAVKRENKERLAAIIQQSTRTTVDPASLFDVQVKRIHEYKRQLLNALRIAHDYLAIAEDGWQPPCPRTYVFAGKAAPGYWTAKQIIRFINGLGETINGDPRARDWMQVVFLPNYRVSLAERIFPASDLSEQISTAGYEASGTGNMKFALNGALTIGTLDGANIEILEEVGPENIFIFGKTADEIRAFQNAPETHNIWDVYHANPGIARVLDALGGDRFSPGDHGRYQWIADTLLHHGDTYFHMVDLPSYLSAQDDAGRLYADETAWTSQSILNVARVGKFSSDRTIREYATDIWNASPVL